MSFRSINSCLAPVASLDGAVVTTIEGIGNERDGYHPVQKRLADYNGSQCGYCSPGMVMAMYSQLQMKAGQLTMVEAEKALDGNLCRCTGYRPILAAAKSFATDCAADVIQQDWPVETKYEHATPKQVDILEAMEHVPRPLRFTGGGA